jgi:hypothetical protein
MMDNGRMIKDMVMAKLFMKITMNIKECGKTIKNMEKDNSYMPQVNYILVNLRII